MEYDKEQSLHRYEKEQEKNWSMLFLWPSNIWQYMKKNNNNLGTAKEPQ